MFLYGYLAGVATIVLPLAYLYAKGFFNEWIKPKE